VKEEVALSKKTVDVKAGDTFVVETSVNATLESVRADARKLYGHEVHICVKVGPWRGEGRERKCDIVPVDDDVLVGSIKNWPQPGCVVYIGHFK
jgi:hypothetical protein